MLYLSSHNYSMTTPTTASPPKKQRQKVRGQPPCSFMTTRPRWSALPGLSETNKSKPKQMATDAAADTLPSRSDRDGLFDKPAETSWIPTPPHLTPMIVPKPTINASPSCAVCRKAFPPMNRLAENHTANHAALAQWRDRRICATLSSFHVFSVAMPPADAAQVGGSRFY